MPAPRSSGGAAWMISQSMMTSVAGPVSSHTARTPSPSGSSRRATGEIAASLSSAVGMTTRGTRLRAATTLPAISGAPWPIT